MKPSKNIVILVIGLPVIVLLTFLSAGHRDKSQEVTMISSMDELELLDINDHLERQVVIIYNEEVKADIGLLGLRQDQVIKGRNLSEHVDVIEVDEQVDIDQFIEELNKNEFVLSADRNGVLRTSTE
jgi:hypothetical protein